MLFKNLNNQLVQEKYMSRFSAAKSNLIIRALVLNKLFVVLTKEQQDQLATTEDLWDWNDALDCDQMNVNVPEAAYMEADFNLISKFMENRGVSDEYQQMLDYVPTILKNSGKQSMDAKIDGVSIKISPYPTDKEFDLAVKMAEELEKNINIENMPPAQISEYPFKSGLMQVSFS